MPGWDEDDLAELEALRDEDDWGDGAFGAGRAFVCRCHCVEEGEIESLAAAGCDVEEIARRTGATTHCSSCLPQVEAIVRACRRAG